MAASALSLDEIRVLHRSQNSETVEVSLLEAINAFVCEHYPRHQTHFTKIPDSFIYEKNRKKAIQGFPSLAKKFKTDKNWLDNVSGNEAEEKVFSYLERCFSNRPSLLLHSLKFNELFKVLKETAREKLKIEEKDKPYPELLKEEKELAEIYGVDLSMEKDKTKNYVNELFVTKSSMNVEEILNKMKTVKNPDKNPEIETNIKKMLKTHGNEMLKEDLVNFIMRYRLNIDLNRNSEFDFWLVDKEACKVFHCEVKAVNMEGEASGLEKAIKLGRKQLREGDDQFKILRKTAQLSPEWQKVNILCLPMIPSIEEVKKGIEKDEVKKNLESMNLLTGQELEGNLFQFPLKSVDSLSEKDAQYSGILGICVGSRFLSVDNQVYFIST